MRSTLNSPNRWCLCWSRWFGSIVAQTLTAHTYKSVYLSRQSWVRTLICLVHTDPKHTIRSKGMVFVSTWQTHNLCVMREELSRIVHYMNIVYYVYDETIRLLGLISLSIDACLFTHWTMHCSLVCRVFNWFTCVRIVCTCMWVCKCLQAKETPTHKQFGLIVKRQRKRACYCFFFSFEVETLSCTQKKSEHEKHVLHLLENTPLADQTRITWNFWQVDKCWYWNELRQARGTDNGDPKAYHKMFTLMIISTKKTSRKQTSINMGTEWYSETGCNGIICRKHNLYNTSIVK